MIDPFLFAIDVINEPEQTKLSLLARAIEIPFSAALTTGINPAEPVMAATTISVS